MNDRRDLDLLLRAQDGDPGCDVTVETLAAYVDLELGGEDPARAYLSRRSTSSAARPAGPITTD